MKAGVGVRVRGSPPSLALNWESNFTSWSLHFLLCRGELKIPAPQKQSVNRGNRMKGAMDTSSTELRDSQCTKKHNPNTHVNPGP